MTLKKWKKHKVTLWLPQLPASRVSSHGTAEIHVEPSEFTELKQQIWEPKKLKAVRAQSTTEEEPERQKTPEIHSPTPNPPTTCLEYLFNRELIRERTWGNC